MIKPGSLVECVVDLTQYIDGVRVLRVPQLETRYIVREVFTDPYNGKVLLCLEEMVFGYNYVGLELGFSIEYFREIQLPPSMELEIQECLTRELVEVWR